MDLWHKTRLSLADTTKSKFPKGNGQGDHAEIVERQSHLSVFCLNHTQTIILLWRLFFPSVNQTPDWCSWVVYLLYRVSDDRAHGGFQQHGTHTNSHSSSPSSSSSSSSDTTRPPSPTSSGWELISGPGSKYQAPSCTIFWKTKAWLAEVCKDVCAKS